MVPPKYVCKQGSPYWHKRSAFQLVGIQAVDWHEESGLLFSLFFFSLLPLLYSVTTFSHRRSAQVQNTYLAKVDGGTFPDPVSNFGAPWRPFWIFEVLEE